MVRGVWVWGDPGVQPRLGKLWGWQEQAAFQRAIKTEALYVCVT